MTKITHSNTNQQEVELTPLQKRFVIIESILFAIFFLGFISSIILLYTWVQYEVGSIILIAGITVIILSILSLIILIIVVRSERSFYLELNINGHKRRFDPRHPRDVRCHWLYNGDFFVFYKNHDVQIIPAKNNKAIINYFSKKFPEKEISKISNNWGNVEKLKPFVPLGELIATTPIMGERVLFDMMDRKVRRNEIITNKRIFTGPCYRSDLHPRPEFGMLAEFNDTKGMGEMDRYSAIWFSNIKDIKVRPAQDDLNRIPLVFLTTYNGIRACYTPSNEVMSSAKMKKYEHELKTLVEMNRRKKN